MTEDSDERLVAGSSSEALTAMMRGVDLTRG
jgi:hypothetical protein